MHYEIRPITDAEVNPFRVEMSKVFGEDLSREEIDDDAYFRDIMPLERTLAAFDAGEIVATFGDKEFEVSLPGGAVAPMAGTTMVTVRPTHTRRGLLRALMARHLEEARRRADPIAGLWASESAIYARFGYGMAVDRSRIDIHLELVWRDADAKGALREVDEAAARDLFPPIHEKTMALRPGMLRRPPVRWKWRLYDPERWREGMSALRHVVYEGTAGLEGYVSYRMKEVWEDLGHSNGKIKVFELVAATPEAHGALWRHVTQIDLFPNVDYWNAPVDDELRFRVTSPRHVGVRTSDSMWIRILDVERALAARAYSASGGVVLELTDPMFDDLSGRYELSVSGGAASCRRTDAAPDLSMGIETLGALYLGGRDLAALQRAGRVAGDQAAIDQAGAMFRWHIAPWCPEVF